VAKLSLSDEKERISGTLRRGLKRRSLAKGAPESDAVGEALEALLSPVASERSAYEVAGELGLIGCLRKARKDLSTNRKHFKGCAASLTGHKWRTRRNRQAVVALQKPSAAVCRCDPCLSSSPREHSDDFYRTAKNFRFAWRLNLRRSFAGGGRFVCRHDQSQASVRLLRKSSASDLPCAFTPEISLLKQYTASRASR